MADPITQAIDRVYDIVDGGIDKIDHAFKRAKSLGDKYGGKRDGQSPKRDGRLPKKSVVIDTSATVKVTKKDPSAAAANPSRRFRVVEAIDAQSGETLFVVTNGNVRAECTTRELAERILHMLETSK